MSNKTKKLCFVIGPIGEAGSDARTHADWLLGGVIRPVFVEHFADYEVLRADEIKAPGDISSQIINRLMDADLVVADMSMHNANAFYELAVRHMMRLPTIYLIRKDFKIPFDVAPHRAIHFSLQQFRDVVEAKAELKAAVDEVISTGFVVENPITHARSKFELDQHATPAMQALASDLAALSSKLDDVQEQLDANREFANLHLGIPPMTGLGRASNGWTSAPGVFATTNMSRSFAGGGPPLRNTPISPTVAAKVSELAKTIANIDQLRGSAPKDDTSE